MKVGEEKVIALKFKHSLIIYFYIAFHKEILLQSKNGYYQCPFITLLNIR